MSKRFSVVARLGFGSEGITPLKIHGTPRLPTYVASILEIFTHHSSVDEAFRAYGCLVQHISKPLPEVKEIPSFQGTGDLLLLVGDRAYLSSRENLDRAYEHAFTHYISGIRTTEPDISPFSPRDATDPRIVDLTTVSRRLPLVAVLLARHHKLNEGPYPSLSKEEFKVHVDELCSVGLLTIPVDNLDFGDFRRFIPFCPDYGYTRGTPIDRYYLGRFVDTVRQEVTGDVLEIGGLPGSQTRYGFFNATRYRVMDLDHVRGADLIGDAHDPLANPTDSLDSIVAFNVLEHCARPWVVVENMHRWLKPNGTAFCMVPNVQRIHRDPMDYWRILPDAFALLFERFRITRLTTYGNLLTSIAAFSGVAVEELHEPDLMQTNPDYPVITCISAVKS